VAAALLARERTGEGQLVSTSLLRIGMYMIGWDISMSLRLGIPAIPMSIKAPPNPLINAYSTADGRRFWMLGLQADRHWPDVLRAIDRPEWAADPRFSTIESRWQYSSELVAELEAVFATRSMEEWAEVFDREDVWWAPVQHAHEVVDDAQAHASGGFVDVPSDRSDGPVKMVASPVDFAGTPWASRSMPPEFGQHTEELLLELGYDWDRIIELKDAGAIP
jgi:crotonobetainyl-CoA:carnitine CoA-transferase CaiB-like acyl-CoA transferase